MLQRLPGGEQSGTHKRERHDNRIGYCQQPLYLRLSIAWMWECEGDRQCFVLFDGTRERIDAEAVDITCQERN